MYTWHYYVSFARGMSRLPDRAADQNCWLRSTKLSSRWSVSMEIMTTSLTLWQ